MAVWYTPFMKPLYQFAGIVRKGNQRGRALGFPTANTDLTLSIPSGIYASTIQLGEQKYHAITFIGEAKTFDETLFQAETYILDFSEEIYGETLVINLLKKIRDNEKFTTVEALKEQMARDEQETRAYFAQIAS